MTVGGRFLMKEVKPCVTRSIQERLDTKLSYTGDAHEETDVHKA